MKMNDLEEWVRILKDLEQEFKQGKQLDEIIERLDAIEKKLDWLIDYLSFGLYQREVTVKPSIGTGDEKELIKYYKEPTTTDGR